MINILFISSNPNGTSTLRIDKEFREISISIQLSKYRDKINLIKSDATRATDLRRVMLYKNPDIIHFSGHGILEGLIFEASKKSTSLIKNHYFSELISMFKGVKCVVLNSCYSEETAKLISESVPYVIGVKSSILDEDAISFSRGFYDALSNNKSIQKSFDFGVNAIKIKTNIFNYSYRSFDLLEPSTMSVDIALIKNNNIKNSNKYLKIITIATSLLILFTCLYLLLITDNNIPAKYW